jgi:hypothetical protein
MSNFDTLVFLSDVLGQMAHNSRAPWWLVLGAWPRRGFASPVVRPSFQQLFQHDTEKRHTAALETLDCEAERLDIERERDGVTIDEVEFSYKQAIRRFRWAP